MRDLRYKTFGQRENITERCWKLFGRPRMDRMIPRDAGWVYCPMETRLPVRRCPVAITIHDIQAFETNLPWSQTKTHRRFRRKWSVWIHKAINESRVVFTVSEFSKRRMVELLGADRDKIVVVGNGVDQRYFDSSEDGNHTSAPKSAVPYLLVVGGLTWKKGAEWVLDLARLLRRQKEDLRFVIAGPAEPRFKVQAEELGNFEFPGFVPDDQLPELYRRSLALLFLSPYEGFGIPVIEAMASGTPAIVSHCASLPEVAGDAGLVVDPQQPEEIAVQIKSLLTDRGLRAGLIAKGRARAQDFTWQRCVDIVHRTLAERG